MATTTTNYELTKAGYNDIPDIETINDNMDTLDSSLVVGESNDDALANITKTTGWTNAEPVTLGDKFQSVMTKISTMIKNLKWIYKFIGSTDISSIGDGTITNAISTLSSGKLNASDVKTSLTDTSTSHALSTASGKALNDAIGNVSSRLGVGSERRITASASGLSYQDSTTSPATDIWTYKPSYKSFTLSRTGIAVTFTTPGVYLVIEGMQRNNAGFTSNIDAYIVSFANNSITYNKIYSGQTDSYTVTVDGATMSFIGYSAARNLGITATLLS